MNINEIDALVFDFDGVLTDNKVLVHQDGSESVLCNRADEGNSTDYGGIGSNRCPSPDQSFFVKRFAIYLRTRVGHIGEHAGRPKEDIVLYCYSSVNRHIVLYLHIVSKGGIVRHEYILSERTAFSNYCTCTNVRKMPNCCTLSNGRTLVHDCGRMNFCWPGNTCRDPFRFSDPSHAGS